MKKTSKKTSELEVKIVNFDYTKADGTTKERNLLVLSEPSDSYFGIELDDPNDLTEVAHYLEYLAERRKQDKALREQYGIEGDDTIQYKRFKLKGIDKTSLTESVLTI